MSKTDRWVDVFLIALIAIHFIILATALARQTFFIFIPVLNIILGLIAIIYWIQHQLRVQQHYIEYGEMIALSIEALFVALCIYSITSNSEKNWLKILSCIICGIHLLLLIGGLYFMFTFKITKLL
jgi:hypothetical protein